MAGWVPWVAVTGGTGAVLLGVTMGAGAACIAGPAWPGVRAAWGWWGLPAVGICSADQGRVEEQWISRWYPFGLCAIYFVTQGTYTENCIADLA